MNQKRGREVLEEENNGLTEGITWQAHLSFLFLGTKKALSSLNLFSPKDESEVLPDGDGQTTVPPTTCADTASCFPCTLGSPPQKTAQLP